MGGIVQLPLFFFFAKLWKPSTPSFILTQYFFEKFLYKEVTASYIPMLQVVDVPSDGDGVKDQRPGIASGGGVESHEEWIFALILLFPKFCNDFPA